MDVWWLFKGIEDSHLTPPSGHRNKLKPCRWRVSLLRRSNAKPLGRGRTKPTLAKCLVMYVALQLDLSDFYELIGSESKLLNDFLIGANQLNELSSSNYRNGNKSASMFDYWVATSSERRWPSHITRKNFFKRPIYSQRSFDINLPPTTISKTNELFSEFTAKWALIGHSLSLCWKWIFYDKQSFQKLQHQPKDCKL